MSVIHHRDRPLMEFPDEPWRPSLRRAVDRSAGASTVSVWQQDFEGPKRGPVHWHEVEEVLVFLHVEGDGWAQLGDHEFAVETDTSVVVPPRTLHSFGLRGHGSMKLIAVLPDADAVPGHRVPDESQAPPTR